MEIIKNNYRLFACFSAKELATLLLQKDFKDLINIAVKNSLEEASKKVSDLAKKQSKLRDSSELWASIFGLYQEFGDSCKVCFLLKNKFNHAKDSINKIEDLIKFKQDPPDVTILYQGKFYDFELKRYFGSINTVDLLAFIKGKILNYSEPLNFYIMLQSQDNTIIEINIFKELSEEIKKLKVKSSTGIICFTFNFDNKYIVNVQVFPEFKVNRYPFVSGSEQIANIMKN